MSDKSLMVELMQKVEQTHQRSEPILWKESAEAVERHCPGTSFYETAKHLLMTYGRTASERAHSPNPVAFVNAAKEYRKSRAEQGVRTTEEYFDCAHCLGTGMETCVMIYVVGDTRVAYSMVTRCRNERCPKSNSTTVGSTMPDTARVFRRENFRHGGTEHWFALTLEAHQQFKRGEPVQFTFAEFGTVEGRTDRDLVRNLNWHMNGEPPEPKRFNRGNAGARKAGHIAGMVKQQIQPKGDVQ